MRPQSGRRVVNHCQTGTRWTSTDVRVSPSLWVTVVAGEGTSLFVPGPKGVWTSDNRTTSKSSHPLRRPSFPPNRHRGHGGVRLRVQVLVSLSTRDPRFLFFYLGVLPTIGVSRS